MDVASLVGSAPGARQRPKEENKRPNSIGPLRWVGPSGGVKVVEEPTRLLQDPHSLIVGVTWTSWGMAGHCCPIKELTVLTPDAPPSVAREALRVLWRSYDTNVIKLVAEDERGRRCPPPRVWVEQAAEIFPSVYSYAGNSEFVEEKTPKKEFRR